MDMVVSVMSRAKAAMFILPCERVTLGKRAAMVMATAMLDTLFLKL
jgi:hypothetical protein